MGEIKTVRELSIQPEEHPDDVAFRLTTVQRMIWTGIAVLQLFDLTRLWGRRKRYHE
jgi:hypothetical protein